MIPRERHVEYLLRLADSPLVLSHRLSEWCGHGPVLEEDLALANIALDLLGQARLLYQRAAELAGGDASEDRYAYFRGVPEFRNFTMLELPNSGVASAGAATFCGSTRAYCAPLSRSVCCSRRYSR